MNKAQRAQCARAAMQLSAECWDDPERAHQKADEILIQLLEGLAADDVVAEYRALRLCAGPWWYA